MIVLLLFGYHPFDDSVSGPYHHGGCHHVPHHHVPSSRVVVGVPRLPPVLRSSESWSD